MFVEPGLIDANVLVYALDRDAPQHTASRDLLEAARDPSTTLYVTSQVLCEFYSVVTNARRVPAPRSPADALGAICVMLTFLHVLPTPIGAVERWLDLLRQPRSWRQCVRFTACGRHAGEQRRSNLHLQRGRF